MQNKKTLHSSQEVLINETYLTDTIQAQSTKAIFWYGCSFYAKLSKEMFLHGKKIIYREKCK